MRVTRLAILLLVSLSICGCMRREGPYAYAVPNPTYAQPMLAPQAAYPAPAYVSAQPEYASAGFQPGIPAATAAFEQPYLLDSGDRLRIAVFGQEGLTNSYVIDPAGYVNLSLIGPVAARGLTANDLARSIGDRLKQGYVRQPHVSVEIEAYRPFFILGEVTAPGQYPFVANMTVETAVAIAGGYSPRAEKSTAQVTRSANGEAIRSKVPRNFPLRPGDTITIPERWF